MGGSHTYTQPLKPPTTSSRLLQQADSVKKRSQADPYTEGLALLARREMFTEELRGRLLRQGYNAQQVEESIRRLTARGALNNLRAAIAYARHAVQNKSRGRGRVLKELDQRGVSPGDSQQATDEAYDDINETILLSRVLNRKLSGPITNQAHFRRLYAALLRQGFDGTDIVKLLKAKTASTDFSIDQ